MKRRLKFVLKVALANLLLAFLLVTVIGAARISFYLQFESEGYISVGFFDRQHDLYYVSYTLGEGANYGYRDASACPPNESVNTPPTPAGSQL
jgi:hypothetical protein